MAQLKSSTVSGNLNVTWNLEAGGSITVEGDLTVNGNISGGNLGTAAELNSSTSTSLGTSNTLLPTQNAVKIYVDNNAGGEIILPLSEPSPLENGHIWLA